MVHLQFSSNAIISVYNTFTDVHEVIVVKLLFTEMPFFTTIYLTLLLRTLFSTKSERESSIKFLSIIFAFCSVHDMMKDSYQLHYYNFRIICSITISYLLCTRLLRPQTRTVKHSSQHFTISKQQYIVVCY